MSKKSAGVKPALFVFAKVYEKYRKCTEFL